MGEIPAVASAIQISLVSIQRPPSGGSQARGRVLGEGCLSAVGVNNRLEPLCISRFLPGSNPPKSPLRRGTLRILLSPLLKGG